MTDAGTAIRIARKPGAWLRDSFRVPSDVNAEGTLASWLFLRSLGLTYLIAFASLWPQLLGLIGSRGMLPAAPFLRAVTQQVGASRFYLLPTLFWFGSGDSALQLVCALGLLFSLLLFIGILELPALLGAWLCYLSFASAGRDFLSFQWDALLLETAIYSLPLVLARPRLRPHLRAVPDAARALLWILLFRFMVAAGWAKLASGDPSWRDFSALDYHLYTQPLPTRLGYYAHQLPSSIKAIACFLMFVVELGVPILIWIPRLRRYAALLLIGLQIVIAATGNYGFFNLQAALLCIPLFPDAWVRRITPRRLLPTQHIEPSSPRASRIITVVLFVILAELALGQFMLSFVSPPSLRKVMRAVLRTTSPFHLSNRYGLFAVMTKDRPEIILEGSRDGVTWIPYEFSWKAGALDRPPPWNAPHQPRLDWQLWFAAMRSREESPFFDGLCIRLLQGSPDVLRLLPRDPWNGQPPRYLRATLWQYTFTTLAEKRQLGTYWNRATPELYMAPVSLDR